jgi:hypothetical protein
VVGTVVGSATAAATAATAGLDLGRDEPARGALRFDLDCEALVKAAEAAGDPLELGGGGDLDADLAAALVLIRKLWSPAFLETTVPSTCRSAACAGSAKAASIEAVMRSNDAMRLLCMWPCLSLDDPWLPGLRKR